MHRHSRRAASLWATLVGLAATGLSAGAQEPGRGPIDVGTERQLFLDRTFLQDAEGVELCVHPPRKTGEYTIRPERPWERGGIGPYSSVLKDGDTYRMWYHCMDTVQWDRGHTNGAVCYAESKDGIQWTRPDLGLTEYEGSRKNNIVFGQRAAGVKIGQDGGMVFLDPTAGPDDRFNLVIRGGGIEGNGVHVFGSPDGIHWHLRQRNALTYRPEERGHHLDSQNVIFWDDRIKKYVAYVRRNMREPGTQGRSIARAESATLDGFPVVQEMPVVLGPDRMDLSLGGAPMVDYYMSAAIKYPWAANAYFMFPTAYFHYVGGHLGEFRKEVPTNAGPLHTQFAASRDGIHWERYDRRPFVPLGMKGEFDWASARTMWGLVPDTTGREMYLYYRASDWLHGWDRDERNKRLLTEAGLGADQNIAVISRLVLRRDGFVSVRAAYTGGSFTTPPLVFRGSQLVLNIDTSATGIARVEIQDLNGKAMEGYSLEDCDLIHTANDVNRVVSWQGRKDVKPLAGRPVRLRFQLRDLDLYAFEFRAGD